MIALIVIGAVYVFGGLGVYLVLRDCEPTSGSIGLALLWPFVIVGLGLIFAAEIIGVFVFGWLKAWREGRRDARSRR